ncbi:MAG: DUF2934 domain-containing protein [Novosphingobium sp.]
MVRFHAHHLWRGDGRPGGQCMADRGIGLPGQGTGRRSLGHRETQTG